MILISEERLMRKINVGKRMCDVAEDILHTSKYMTYCDALRLAILVWRKHEALAERAAYEEVLHAGNELYKLLDYAVRNFNPSLEDERLAAQVMSAWFETLTHEESKELASFITAPYNFA